MTITNEIIQKKKLANNIYEFKIKNSNIASFASPGQFVIVILDAKSERIPITIASIDKINGNITLVIQNVGFSTNKIVNLQEGNIIKGIVGPLGNPSKIERKNGFIVFIGGGLGIAAINPQIKKCKSIGNHIISIIGARSQDLLFYEKEIKLYSDELLISTNDGSRGYKGYVTDILKLVLKKQKKNNAKISRVIIIGPTILMKTAVEILDPFKDIEIIVSLNPLMIDGIGMCGCCRVSINNDIKFACIDGPEFDGRLVNFNLLTNKLLMYSKKEKDL